MFATCLRPFCFGVLLLLEVQVGAAAAPEPPPLSVAPEAERQALAAYYQEHDALPRNGEGPWLEFIARTGSPEDLRKLCQQISRGQFDAPTTIRAVDTLAAAALDRHIRPTSNGKESEPLSDPDYQMLLPLLHSPDTRLQTAAARLAGAWKQAYVGTELAAIAGRADRNAQAAAFEALRQIGGKTALTFFSVLARPDQKIETRCHALVAMAPIQLDAAVVQASEVLPSVENEALALETWRGLLQVDRSADAFAVRLPGNLPQPVISAGLQASQEMGKAGSTLARALKTQERSRK